MLPMCVVVKFHRDSLYVVKLTKLDVALTLSYLMDLWLHRKFCPSFEVRRSGGEEERFASGVCSCVMVCYWEFFPSPLGEKQLSGQSQSLTNLDGRNLLKTFSWIAPCFYVWQTSN